MSILIAILIFGMIIATHELGHFISAKLCGIKVNEFALGMGFRIFHFKKGETEYSLRLFPIGGFCSMEGEDSESDDKRAFCSKPVWQRIIVVVAGATVNILTGVILTIVLASMYKSIPSTTVNYFASDSDTKEIVASSYESGLREGDKIIRINGLKVFTYSDISYELASESDKPFTLEVERAGKNIILENVTFGNKNTGEKARDFAIETLPKTAGNVLSYSLKDSVSTARLIWISLSDLLKGKYGADELSGPVGTISVIGQASEIGETVREKVMSLLNLTIFITINIGIFNLLPIPALDGGRLVFLLIEAVRRKPIKPEYEAYVHAIGMLLLFGLMIFATYNDIMRLRG
ncbi:MAG: site-2 protease family protein [Ruminococcus sp.]|nr:site-2 protease family protein [Ruminococcus sp.]